MELIVSPEYLARGERVLIIDDFLASGATILGLVRLTQAAGAEVVGIGTLIEKIFEGGRAALAASERADRSRWCASPRMDDGKIEFAGLGRTHDRRHRHPGFWLPVFAS